jgi:hypothetical protein
MRLRGGESVRCSLIEGGGAARATSLFCGSIGPLLVCALAPLESVRLGEEKTDFGVAFRSKGDICTAPLDTIQEVVAEIKPRVDRLWARPTSKNWVFSGPDRAHLSSLFNVVTSIVDRIGLIPHIGPRLSTFVSGFYDRQPEWSQIGTNVGCGFFSNGQCG